MKHDEQVHEVAICDICIDRETQIREDLSEETVQRYCDVMEDEESLAKFPPILLYRDQDGKLWLADGHHRVAAARRRGFTTIHAIIIDGSKSDAIWAAAESNSKNALPLNKSDMSRAVRLLLEAWPDRSNRAIAAALGCNEKTVRKYRSPKSGADGSAPEMRTGKDGKSYSVVKTQSTSPKMQVIKNSAQPPQPQKNDTNPELNLSEEAISVIAGKECSTERDENAEKRLAELKQFCEENYSSPWPHEMARDLTDVLPQNEQCHLASVFFSEMIAKWKYKPELPNIMVNFIRNNFLCLNEELQERSLRSIFNGQYGESDLVDKIMDLVKSEGKRYDTEFAELDR